MKKVLFGLGVVATLSFPVVGMGYGEDDYLGSEENYSSYFVVPGFGLNEEVSNSFDLESASTYTPLFSRSVAQKHVDYGTVDLEGTTYTIEGAQHLKNLDNFGLNNGSFVTDLRPLNNLKKMKYLDIVQPLSSLSFLNNMHELEEIRIVGNNITNFDYPSSDDEIDEQLYAITDLTVLNSLNKLKDAQIKSEDRLFPTISLKKSMDKYVLVNPFILSKQFKNPKVEITSKTPGFTFEDDILTWDGITPKTKELQISWEFNSNEGGNFTFSGDSVIPINWID